MNRLISFALCALAPVVTMAADTSQRLQPGLISPAAEYDLADFQWQFRLIVIFTDTGADPQFSEQMERLQAGIKALEVRDVLILTDIDPELNAPARQQLRPRGFQFVLIGKDGRVLMRRPSPQSVREITRSIDKLPTRQREIKERRSSG